MHNLDKEFSLEYIRASGPGGQNVNKVSTAVQLRFDVMNSQSLTEPVRLRLIKIAGKRLTAEGILILEGHKYRTQEKNREDVIQRFYHWIKKAGEKPKPRFKTRPSMASKEERLRVKKKRAEVKKYRNRTRGEYE